MYDLWCNLSYNSLNYITDITISAGAISYDYDAEGYRTLKTEYNITTSYVVNPNAELSQVLTSTTNGETTYYVYGLGLVSQENSEGYKLYHYDYRGSTTAITNINGTVTDIIYYDPYGNIAKRSGATETPFLYVGKYGVETDTNGLYYMRARYYNPTIQRFINVDPIRDGYNWYGYVGQNPNNNIDPLGINPRPYEPDIWNKGTTSEYNKKYSTGSYDKEDDTIILFNTNCYMYALDFKNKITYGRFKGYDLYYSGYRSTEKFRAQNPGDLRELISYYLDSNEQLYRNIKGIVSNPDPELTDFIKFVECSSTYLADQIRGAWIDSLINEHTFRLASDKNVEGLELAENEWVVALVGGYTETVGYHWYRQNAGTDGKFDGTWSHKPGQEEVTNLDSEHKLITDPRKAASQYPIFVGYFVVGY